MKRIVLCVVAAAAICLCMSSCSKEKKLRESLSGEWHAVSGLENVDVWLSLNSDETFELFQKAGDGRYALYRGEWKLSKDILSGSYNDGTAWGSSYRVSFSGDTSMTLSAQNGSGENILYEAGSVPADVRENCIVEVKSFHDVDGDLRVL